MNVALLSCCAIPALFASEWVSVEQFYNLNFSIASYFYRESFAPPLSMVRFEAPLQTVDVLQLDMGADPYDFTRQESLPEALKVTKGSGFYVDSRKKLVSDIWRIYKQVFTPVLHYVKTRAELLPQLQYGFLLPSA